eukprot:4203679-Prymnesium_polylepis.1
MPALKNPKACVCTAGEVCWDEPNTGNPGPLTLSEGWARATSPGSSGQSAGGGSDGATGGSGGWGTGGGGAEGGGGGDA